MKILVKGLQVLSKTNVDKKDYDFDGKHFTVDSHVLYMCFVAEDNTTVKVRDFKNLLNWEVGKIVEHTFNVSSKNLKLDIK